MILTYLLKTFEEIIEFHDWENLRYSAFFLIIKTMFKPENLFNKLKYLGLN